MNKQEIFDECVEEAMKFGEKYMEISDSNIPTIEEWQLALLLFKKRI